MLDVESGTIVSPAHIVVEGDRITAVGTDAVPDGATAIDVRTLERVSFVMKGGVVVKSPE